MSLEIDMVRLAYQIAKSAIRKAFSLNRGDFHPVFPVYRPTDQETFGRYCTYTRLSAETTLSLQKSLIPRVVQFEFGAFSTVYEEAVSLDAEILRYALRSGHLDLYGPAVDSADPTRDNIYSVLRTISLTVAGASSTLSKWGEVEK